MGGEIRLGKGLVSRRIHPQQIWKTLRGGTVSRSRVIILIEFACWGCRMTGGYSRLEFCYIPFALGLARAFIIMSLKYFIRM